MIRIGKSFIGMRRLLLGVAGAGGVTGGKGMMRIHWAVLWLSLAMLSTVPLALAEERIWLVTEPSQGMPPCEEFFDKWEAPGAPPGLLAMAGFSREVFAAKECVDKGDVATACKHWQGLLAVIDKMGPPLNENRGDVENLMREHKCEAVPAPDTKPASDSTPPSDSKPAAKVTSGPGNTAAKPSSETGPSPAPDPDSGPGPSPAE